MPRIGFDEVMLRAADVVQQLRNSIPELHDLIVAKAIGDAIADGHREALDAIETRVLHKEHH